MVACDNFYCLLWFSRVLVLGWHLPHGVIITSITIFILPIFSLLFLWKEMPIMVKLMNTYVIIMAEQEINIFLYFFVFVGYKRIICEKNQNTLCSSQSCCYCSSFVTLARLINLLLNAERLALWQLLLQHATTPNAQSERMCGTASHTCLVL